MHDILEGSLQYEMKELFKHCISDKIFSLLIEFPYVLTDKATRLSMIAPNVLASADHSVKQKG